MTTYVALFTLELPNPDAVAEFTGRFDEHGQPILTSKPKIVHYGDTFELDDPAIIADLKAERAICLADEWNAPAAADPNSWPKAFVGRGAESYI